MVKILQFQMAKTFHMIEKTSSCVPLKFLTFFPVFILLFKYYMLPNHFCFNFQPTLDFLISVDPQLGIDPGKVP